MKIKIIYNLKSSIGLIFFFLLFISMNKANAKDTAPEKEDLVTVSCLSQVNISLDGSGNASIVPDQVAFITGDISDLDFITVTPNTFDCSDVGSLLIPFTLTWSESSIVSSCTGNLLIEDKTSPLIACFSSVNISLGFDGNTVLASDFFIANVVDNCPLTYSFSPSSVNCADAGSIVLVAVTGTDSGGNSNVCTSNVLVEDKIAPTVICIANYLVDLAGTPSVSIAPSDIDFGSSDNCGIASTTLSQSTFTSADIGVNLVNLVAVDGSANSNICTTEIEVIDSEATYCEANGASTSREFIKKVKFRTINNLSNDNNGYADFTVLEARVRRGRDYDITLKPGFHGSKRRQFWTVWIDWNQNQIFEASELVARGRSKNNITRNVSIPPFATPGTTRMRVMMKRGGYGNPCDLFPKGEVEDYSIFVKPIAPALITPANNESFASISTKDTSLKRNLSIVLSPNPVVDLLSISGFEEEENNQIYVYNNLGQLVFEQKIIENIHTIPTYRWQKGTYTLIVQTDTERKAYPFILIK